MGVSVVSFVNNSLAVLAEHTELNHFQRHFSVSCEWKCRDTLTCWGSDSSHWFTEFIRLQEYTHSLHPVMVRGRCLFSEHTTQWMWALPDSYQFVCVPLMFLVKHKGSYSLIKQQKKKVSAGTLTITIWVKTSFTYFDLDNLRPNTWQNQAQKYWSYPLTSTSGICYLWT